MYLAGGCFADQVCLDDGAIFYCICTAVTDKMMYFSPSTRKYTVLNTTMPRERYRHMGRLGYFVCMCMAAVYMCMYVMYVCRFVCVFICMYVSRFST
ncbi:hypothetical protein EON63_11335 [archaeon]|nr:MAG: hypothetical protein EON63_11335 [archaeon]